MFRDHLFLDLKTFEALTCEWGRCLRPQASPYNSQKTIYQHQAPRTIESEKKRNETKKDSLRSRTESFNARRSCVKDKLSYIQQNDLTWCDVSKHQFRCWYITLWRFKCFEEIMQSSARCMAPFQTENNTNLTSPVPIECHNRWFQFHIMVLSLELWNMYRVLRLQCWTTIRKIQVMTRIEVDTRTRKNNIWAKYSAS